MSPTAAALGRRPLRTLLCAGALLGIALGLASPSQLEAQTRGNRRGRSSQSQSTAAADTAAAIARRANTAEEPADLAYATITGTSTAVASREPALPAPPHMTQSELRVLDTRRRNSEPLVPLRGYATAERPTVANRPGYVDASIGLHTTARLKAGYSGSSWPFDYYGNVGLDLSTGFAEENPHRSITVAAGAGYIIDEGYGIFSGGHMGADVRYDNYRYHLYALPSSPVRQANTVTVGATGANTTDGLTYDAGARYRSLSIDADSTGSRETSLEGALSIATSWDGLGIGAQTDLRLTYLDGSSISYGRLQGWASYSNRIMTLRGGLQLSAGANSDGSTSGTIAPTGELRLFPLHGLTVIGTITGGLAPTTLAGLSAINPYVTLEPTIRQQREKIGYQVHVRIEPSRAFAIRGSAARSHYNDYAYFDSVRAGEFAPSYGSAIVNRIVGDLSWRIDEQNNVLAAVEFTDGVVGEARALPFTPKWVGDASYSHRFDAAPLTVDAGARYIGERSASNSRTLAPVTLVNLGARYAVSPRFDLTLELRNLLNQRYELWEGYTERGVFAAVGASARF